MTDSYKRDFSFNDSKDDARNRQKLDEEFDSVGKSLIAMRDLIAKSFNDDGSLKSGVIDSKAISKSVVLLPEEAERWTPSKFYKIGAVVYVDSSIRWCAKPHVAENFEKETEFWETVIDFKPFYKQMELIAGNSRVARVSANIEQVTAVAQNMAKLLELHQSLEMLSTIQEFGPALKFLSEGGAAVILAVHKKLDSIAAVAGELEQIRKVSVSLNKIDAVASVELKLAAVEKSLDDIKIVAAFVKQLKSIAAGVGGATG